MSSPALAGELRVGNARRLQARIAAGLPRRQQHRGHLRSRHPRAEGRFAFGAGRENRRAARRERRRQDHHAQGDLQPPPRRARRGHQGNDRVPRPPRGPPEPRRAGEARRGAGHGRAPLLRASHRRGEPSHRGLHAQRGPGELRQDLERVYAYFPQLKERRGALAGYTSGGEQQMTALGRALMAHPSMILLDEPSMGLAPQIVEEIFEIVRSLNQKEEVSFLLAEQNTHVALRYADHGYILENGRVVMDGAAAELAANEDVKEFYLGISSGARRSL